jgi:hypothetical protein
MHKFLKITEWEQQLRSLVETQIIDKKREAIYQLIPYCTDKQQARFYTLYQSVEQIPAGTLLTAIYQLENTIANNKKFVRMGVCTQRH